MKQTRTFPAASVTGKQEAAIKQGHPWIYEDEIVSAPAEIHNGSLVDVLGRKGQYLGTGFWSQASKIRIRLLSRNANETFADAFWQRRVRYALEYRRDVMPEYAQCVRLVHGEADGLPGLTVDRYNDILVSEVLSYGMETVKPIIYQALADQLAQAGAPISGIYERNEGELRAKEGLPAEKGWYALPGLTHPSSCLTTINENGVLYQVDVENGQKTGFYLDQKLNRLAVRRLAKGRRVLDCCTHTGSFAINAALGEAATVSAVDVSAAAIGLARENAALNHLADRIQFETADLFDYLPQLNAQHASYDLIILDPPAFTKSRRTFRNARHGYQTINELAMRLLPRGGYLATCSCSHFMPAEEFKTMLAEAAQAVGVSVRIVEERHAAMDHPVLIGVPETEYLKFIILQIV